MPACIIFQTMFVKYYISVLIVLHTKCLKLFKTFGLVWQVFGPNSRKTHQYHHQHHNHLVIISPSSSWWERGSSIWFQILWGSRTTGNSPPIYCGLPNCQILSTSSCSTSSSSGLTSNLKRKYQFLELTLAWLVATVFLAFYSVFIFVTFAICLVIYTFDYLFVHFHSF